MNEKEWLACDDPRPMLRSLCRRPRRKVAGGPGLGPERFRVFAVACARRVWELLSPNLRLVVEHLERYAPDPEFLRLARQVYEAEAEQLRARDSLELATVIGQASPDYRALEELSARQWAAQAVGAAASVKPYDAAARHSAAARALGIAEALARCPPPQRIGNSGMDWDGISANEYRAQAGVLRDVFGNPYRKVVIEPAWLAWNDRTVPRIAEEVCAARDPRPGGLDAARLSVLADALEEAGCAEALVLDHLRGPGPHVLGCWVVSLILNKE